MIKEAANLLGNFSNTKNEMLQSFVKVDEFSRFRQTFQFLDCGKSQIAFQRHTAKFVKLRQEYLKKNLHGASVEKAKSRFNARRQNLLS
jgi:hypothetical protein